MAWTNPSRQSTARISSSGREQAMNFIVSKPTSNQVRVVAFSLPQLTQALFLQKNQTVQNRFLISVKLR